MRTFGVGQRQETLPDPPLLIKHVPNGSDRIAGLAVLDRALAGASDPDLIIVEIANNLPDVRGGLFEYGAVIGARRLYRSLQGLSPHRGPKGGGLPTRSPIDRPVEPIEISAQTAT